MCKRFIGKTPVKEEERETGSPGQPAHAMLVWHLGREGGRKEGGRRTLGLQHSPETVSAQLM